MKKTLEQTAEEIRYDYYDNIVKNNLIDNVLDVLFQDEGLKTILFNLEDRDTKFNALAIALKVHLTETDFQNLLDIYISNKLSADPNGTANVEIFENSNIKDIKVIKYNPLTNKLILCIDYIETVSKCKNGEDKDIPTYICRAYLRNFPPEQFVACCCNKLSWENFRFKSYVDEIIYKNKIEL